MWLPYFIYFWLHWVFMAALSFSLVMLSGGYFPTVVCGPLIAVVSLTAESMGSRPMGFSSCGAWAQ